MDNQKKVTPYDLDGKLELKLAIRLACSMYWQCLWVT